MEDSEIIGLYFKRSESAIEQTKKKYGRLLVSVSFGILKSMEDAFECENDTYFKAWNVIPPEHPNILSAFLSKIIRNISLDRYDKQHAKKRGNGEIPLMLDELEECIGTSDTEKIIEDKEMAAILNRFLAGLKKDSRIIFMRRYWYGDSVQEIAKKSSFKESKVKMSLKRTRDELKKVLLKEGYAL